MENRASRNQAAAELAVAKALGWDDWTPDEESEPGMVRSLRVQWSAFPDAGLIVHGDDEDSMRYVLVTGDPPNMTIDGWITAGEAKRLGTRIYDG